MRILSADTSAKTASVAVVDENGTIASCIVNNSLTHSQTLMPMISSMLSTSKLSIGEIDAFACSSGPGSFTGLRIGIGAIKGLAYGANKPCIGISTLEALGYNLIGIDGIVCAVMDARCNQVYTATFLSENGRIERITQDRAVSINDLKADLKKIEKTIFLVGDGAILCYNKMQDELADVRPANDLIIRQNASSVGAIALKKLLLNEALSARELLPTYLRLPQAQRELNEKTAQGK